MDNMDVPIDEFLQRLANELKRKPNRRIQEFQTRLRPILLNLLKEQRPRNEITNYQLVLTKLELRMVKDKRAAEAVALAHLPKR